MDEDWDLFYELTSFLRKPIKKDKAGGFFAGLHYAITYKENLDDIINKIKQLYEQNEIAESALDLLKERTLDLSSSREMRERYSSFLESFSDDILKTNVLNKNIEEGQDMYLVFKDKLEKDRNDGK